MVVRESDGGGANIGARESDRGFGEERENEKFWEWGIVVERHKIINIRSACFFFSMAQWAELGLEGPIVVHHIHIAFVLSHTVKMIDGH